MAQITTIQPLDFLKNSRSIINQNFSNLNVALTALSANVGNVGYAAVSALSADINTLTLLVSALSTQGGTSYPTRNIEIDVYGGTGNHLDDQINIKAARVLLGTLSPLLNGNITLSANNGYIQHITDGPGTQLIDNLQNTQYGGSWLEFYRVNSTSSVNILNGTAYNVKDLPYLLPTGSLSSSTTPIDALVVNGNTNDTSLYFVSSFGDPYSAPGIYVPSINNAALGCKLELNGPGVIAQELTIGGQLRFNPDNFDGYYTSPKANFNVKTDNTTVRLSSDGDSFNIYGNNIFIGTTHPLLNGNITLSANNGYTIIESDGPGLQIKDNVQGTIYGGNWIEFYRTNGASGIFVGTGYSIKDSPTWPATPGSTTEALSLLGSHNDSSLYFSVYPDYNQDIPAIYIPSVNNDLLGYKIEVLGHNGLLSRKLTVGGQLTYAGYNTTTTTSAINFEIYPDDLTGTTVLSGSQKTKILSNDIIIGTTHPLLNGNITLSANNGYTIIESIGPGLQIKDNVQGTQYGGSWIEFYRTNGGAGVFNGTAYSIRDVLNFPIQGKDNESIVFTGNTYNTGIYLASTPDYNLYNVPGIYIPSVNNSLSGCKVQVTGRHGLSTPNLNIGGELLAGDTTYNLNSAVNLHFGAKSSTQASTMSASQNLEMLADSYKIGTKNPLKNGNITLSANNGYVIIETLGTGLQIKDDCQNSNTGGNWVEFYRINTAPGDFVGTAYTVKDIPNFTTAGIDTLGIMGTNSNSNIFLAANTDYHDDTPAILVTSTNNAALSGTGVSVIGTNGLFARALTVGNTPYIGTTAPSANTNFEISYNDFTSTVYLSALEAATTLQIGSVSAINFADNSTQTTAYTGAYTPAVPSNWNGAAPTTIQGALDRIAAAIKALNGVGP